MAGPNDNLPDLEDPYAPESQLKEKQDFVGRCLGFSFF
jgi:hypothetical protein